MTETGVLKPAWRYRTLVLVIIVAFGVIAGMVAVARPESNIAEATVVLEDPSSNLLAFGVTESSRRSVANQLEIFRSSLVATKAAELAAGAGYEVTEADVIDNTIFTTLSGTDVITVSYSNSEPELAVVVADAIVAAYDEVQLEQSRASNSSSLERLDVSEDLLLEEFMQVQGQINTILAVRDTETQIQATLDSVSSLQSTLLGTTDPETRASLLNQLAEFQAQLETLRLAAEIENRLPQLASLLDDRERLETQLTAIDVRRTEIQIDSAVEGSGIAFYSPAAITDASSGAGLLFSILGGILLGTLVALGVAYTLGNRRKEFVESSEPEPVLSAPFLAEVPRWGGTGGEFLPVRDDPRSLAAESFRFVHASVDIRLKSDGYKSVSFVSGHVGEGKSTLIANTALAAARSGKRVLLIDADFGSQALSQLLVKEWMRPGLTDLVLGSATLESAVSTVPVSDGGGQLYLLGRGTAEVTAPDFFANPLVGKLMSTLEGIYDMVLIDGPPLLQIAYASSIAQLAGALVYVVPHGSHIKDAEALARRVRFIGSPVVGYIYNLAPRQTGREVSGGSMSDVLGDKRRLLPTSANPTR
jgi:Mrp family chromosome partitioning ATPase/uncharacterized protein involved in exopolysaccharide biosynthesis